MWTMEEPASTVAALLADESQSLPVEILRLTDDTAAIIVEVEGVDYVLTMARVPVQRARPTRQ